MEDLNESLNERKVKRYEEFGMQKGRKETLENSAEIKKEKRFKTHERMKYLREGQKERKIKERRRKNTYFERQKKKTKMEKNGKFERNQKGIKRMKEWRI